MKSYCLIILALFAASCSDFNRQQELSTKIQQYVQEVCLCSSVHVEENQHIDSGKQLIVEMNVRNVIDLNAKAEEIISVLEEKLPEISENEEIVLRFKYGEAHEDYTYEGSKYVEDVNILHITGK